MRRILTITLWAICTCALLAAPNVAPAGPATGGLELWLDADDASTLTLGAGNIVTAWADKAGGDHNAAPVSAGNEPVLAASVIGGKPAVQFNQQSLKLASNLPINADEDRTVFVVMDYSVSTGNSEMLGTSTSNMIDVGQWNQPWRLRLRQGDNLFSGANTLPAGSHIIAVQGDAAGTRAWDAGASLIDSTEKRFHWTMNVGTMRIGGADFAGREYIGNLAEVLIYDRALNRYEMGNTGAYLQDKYSLAGEYKALAPPVASGMALWLDSADTATVTLDGSGGVTQWQDKCGGSHHATNMDTAPAWVPGGLNGLPALQFSRTVQGGNAGNTMAVAGDVGIAAGQDRTLFVVMDYQALYNNSEVLGNGTGEMLDVGTWTGGPHTDNRLRLRNGGTNTFSDPDTVPFGPIILAVESDGTGLRAYVNGWEILDQTSDAFDWAITTAFKVGGTDFPSTTDLRNFDGLLGEVLLYDRALNRHEIGLVGEYLGEKYQIANVFVPEPASLALLVTGLAGMGGYLRRRR